MREIYKDEFATYHPVVNMAFFLGAIIMGMFFIHPAFVAVSILIAVLYLLTLKKNKYSKRRNIKHFNCPCWLIFTLDESMM